MELEDYWGVGPKTTATLESTVGRAAAVEAIETSDIWTLVDAGIDRHRATRVLRRANSKDGMELLATRDARSVYKELIDAAAVFAVNDDAAGRVRTLTPLTDRAAIETRLDAVEAAVETWAGLDDATRRDVLVAFEEHDPADGGRLAAVRAVVALEEAGVSGPAFEPIADLDADQLADAATALEALSDDRLAGADEELDRLRADREAVDAMVADAASVVEELRSEGVREAADVREGLVDHVRAETTVDPARVREAAATEAADATAFVTESLRALRAELDAAADERETAVREELEADLEAAGGDVDRARRAVAEVGRDLSIARFAEAFDLTRPDYADWGTLAVADARNLSLAAADGSVQPVTYALGDHGLSPPIDDRVSVLTGANSGGKTTLLETLCQVQLLAHMGLPVPAERAVVSPCDRVVFHRRHASFNAGVLESTLRSVVPPLVSGDRTLMLVDEFEAITEPGRAADLLYGLVDLTVEEGALGTFVTHLADDLEPLPEPARVDGIFAEGLTDDLELEVDYQPRFGEVGRSTPEFIVSRLVADADDREEEAGFRTLARSVDTDVVQRTLSEAEWNADADAADD
ncbi:DNA mismatch repair protein [Halobacteriales archaeon QS_8_69_73]|nr:MAG: DNA mismatch repair protein [Halobacteriales archaeon QS_8_69_73]